MAPVNPKNTHQHVRLTDKARAKLEDAGASIIPEGSPKGVTTYTVTLGDNIPKSLIVAQTRIIPAGKNKYEEFLCLRMSTESEYPGEFGANYYWQSGLL